MAGPLARNSGFAFTRVKDAFAIAPVRRDEMRVDFVGESGNEVYILDANSWRKSSEARSSVSCVLLGKPYQFA